MVPLEFFIDIILRRALWPWGQSGSNRNEYREYFRGRKGGRCVRLTTLPPSCADMHEIWKPQSTPTLLACTLPLLPTHCTCRGLLFHVIIHTHMLGLPWTRDRLVVQACTCTTNTIHKTQSSMSPVAKFEPAIPTSQRPQAYVFNSAVIWIGFVKY